MVVKCIFIIVLLNHVMTDVFICKTFDIFAPMVSNAILTASAAMVAIVVVVVAIAAMFVFYIRCC